MSAHDCAGCREYHELSRRQFLGVSGGAVIAAGIPSWLPRVVYADDECSSRDVIVSIFLRGAADGLTMCAPHGEDAYYSARPTLAVPRPDSGDPHRLTDLDGFFGLPPALTPLTSAYTAGHLLFVHACGSTDSTRSHFDGQRFIEVGKPADPLLHTGWLGRHLATVPPLSPSAILRGVAIGYGLPRGLVGGPLTLPIPDLDGFGLTGNAATTAARRAALIDMYNQVGDPLETSAHTSLATIDLLDTINFAGYQPAGGAVYPTGPFGTALKSLAALIKADVGVEAAAVDLAGWDTHNNQGIYDGVMFRLMDWVGRGLAAFHADIFAGNGRNVTVVVMSEFGRRLAENGALGTEHGHGNAMMVLGNNIRGGRVLTQWPGLATEQLFEGIDLEVTIDFRDVLAEIVQNRLGNSDLTTVFPGYTPTFRGVTRQCPPVPGDADYDGDLDLADHAAMAGCLTGPGTTGSSGCTEIFDADGDADVDLLDVAEFQAGFTN
jgi:uncharacterized protein (DUF1501 family)